MRAAREILKLSHRRGRASMDRFERYLRLAFKAQSQCRATFETLAEMKNPPVFTRQASSAIGTAAANRRRERRTAR